MKKNFIFYDPCFQKKLSGLLLLLFACTNLFGQSFCGSMSQSNNHAKLSYTTIDVNDSANACCNVSLAAFSTG